jgi:threonine aldolase
MATRSFASDNNAGVHQQVIEAIQKVNEGHVIAYGDDQYTESTKKKFKSFFGEDIEVFFVFNGTAANVLGLTAAIHSFNSVITAETAHINSDECGAPEKYSGCKILTLPTPDGKLTVVLISKHMHGFGFEHHSQPKVVSITQSSEMGTVYQLKEIKAIASYVHSNGMILHMDGARIANASVTLGNSFREMTGDCGVDILSFGGTKNGLMFGEAVIFFNKSLAENFKYIRKQGMQLASKMRYISAQFNAYLSNDLWKQNALHSNQMAKVLGREVAKIPQIKITQEIQANGVFAIVPPHIIKELQNEYFFYMWNEEISEVRWMCSYDTTEEDIHSFVDKIKLLLK